MLMTNIEGKKKPNKTGGRKRQEAVAAEDKTPRQDLSNMTTSNSVKLTKICMNARQGKDTHNLSINSLVPLHLPG